MTTESDELPLFPLQTPLFPDGLLRLSIFEPRYLDMIQRCERERRPFGVVALIEGSEVRQRDANGPGFVTERFHGLGTLAWLQQVERPQAGLLRIRCLGGQRFRLGGARCLAHGLWLGRVELLPPEASLPVPEDLRGLSRLLQQLLHNLAQGAADADLPLQPPYHWQDCAWLANRWCELLPLSAAEKQRLLSVDSPLLRLELVSDLLEKLGLGPGEPEPRR